LYLLFFSVISLNNPSFSQNKGKWTWYNPLPQGNLLTDCSAVDSLYCWACGNFGTLLQTTDGGKTWNIMQSRANNKGENFDRIVFLDINRGFATGTDSQGKAALLKTMDGGKNWEKQYEYQGNAFSGIQFIDSHHGWVRGSSSIVRTTDGGLTWETVDMHFNIEAIHFTDEKYGWCVGNYLYKTTNGGRRWIKKELFDNPACFADIIFVNENVGYVLEVSLGIYKTTDGGEIWIPTNQITDINLDRIVFTEEYSGWAYSDKSVLLKYSESTGEENNNGGSNNEPNNIPSIFELHQNYPNPFNNYTTLKFNLPEEGIPDFKIYNVLGELVTTIRPRTYGKGLNKMKWDGKDKYGRQVWW